MNTKCSALWGEPDDLDCFNLICAHVCILKAGMEWTDACFWFHEKKIMCYGFCSVGDRIAQACLHPWI